MALKPYEKFVRDCLLKYLCIDNSMAWDGEDPPDIYINANEETVAVEITTLSPVSFDQNGKVQNRHTQDYFGLNLCDDLNLELKDYVPKGVDIILTLYVPIENARKYKKELRASLTNIIEKGINVGDKLEFKISGSKVKLSVVPCRDYSQKRIAGLVVNNNSTAFIQNNAEVILGNCILDKVDKCKKIQHDGSMWLALFNDYWLASHDTYYRALRNLSVRHDFKKIFVISDTSIVKQIY